MSRISVIAFLILLTGNCAQNRETTQNANARPSESVTNTAVNQADSCPIVLSCKVRPDCGYSSTCAEVRAKNSSNSPITIELKTQPDYPPSTWSFRAQEEKSITYTQSCSHTVQIWSCPKP